MKKEKTPYNQFSFNYLKHHISSSIEYCNNNSFLLNSKNNIKNLIEALKSTGYNITDIYTGSLSIYNIFDDITFKLKELNFFEYYKYLKLFKENGYHKLEVSDGSIWILRLGKQLPGYIHIHPARIGTLTIRYAANTWKTALICYIFKLNNPDFDCELSTINMLRTNYLELSPIKKLRNDSKITEAYKLILDKASFLGYHK